VIHADGATGSLTPQGRIFFSWYSERVLISEILAHKSDRRRMILDDEDVSERRPRDGTIREDESWGINGFKCSDGTSQVVGRPNKFIELTASQGAEANDTDIRRN
jgi:hypothetical protein